MKNDPLYRNYGYPGQGVKSTQYIRGEEEKRIAGVKYGGRPDSRSRVGKSPAKNFAGSYTRSGSKPRDVSKSPTRLTPTVAKYIIDATKNVEDFLRDNRIQTNILLHKGISDVLETLAVKLMSINTNNEAIMQKKHFENVMKESNLVINKQIAEIKNYLIYLKVPQSTSAIGRGNYYQGKEFNNSMNAAIENISNRLDELKNELIINNKETNDFISAIIDSNQRIDHTEELKEKDAYIKMLEDKLNGEKDDQEFSQAIEEVNNQLMNFNKNLNGLRQKITESARNNE